MHALRSVIIRDLAEPVVIDREEGCHLGVTNGDQSLYVESMTDARTSGTTDDLDALRRLLDEIDGSDLTAGADADVVVSTTTALLGHLNELAAQLSAQRSEAVRALLVNESGAAVAARHGLTRQTIHKLARRS